MYLDADEAAEGQRGNDRAAIIADRHGNAGAVHDGFAVVEGVAVALGLPDGLTENRRVGDGVGGDSSYFYAFYKEHKQYNVINKR